LLKQPQVKTLPQPPDCGFNRKFQEFIPNDYGIEICEDIERKECPEPDCKSNNFSVFMAEKDTVFYPQFKVDI
jgi:hypothetical protein